MKRSWKEEIQYGQTQKWQKWLTDLQQLSSFNVSRCTKPASFGPPKTAQLHYFSEASQDGNVTATYLLLTNEEGKEHGSFLMGKSRISPLKQITIPRI
jgi:hypothetical protein